MDNENKKYEIAKMMLPFFVKEANENKNGRLVTGVLSEAVENAVEVAELLIQRLKRGGER